MEKQKLTIPYIIHNWSSLSVSQKRTALTVLLFGVALLLIVIALIIGISSCTCAGKAQNTTETVSELPALLRAPVPERSAEQDPEDPTGEQDPGEPDAIIADPNGTGENAPAATYASLKKHDKGEEVADLQARLMELGYLEIEEPTDYFGNSTEYAVELFQRQHGLKQDGIAGEQTQALLFSTEAQHYMLLEGAEGRDVKMLQEQLVDLGYLDESDIDQVYGEKTVEAVKAFQKRNGLSADGKAGEKTLDKLFGEDPKVSKSLEAKLKEESKSESKSTPKTTPKPTKHSSKTTPKTSSKATSKTTPKTKTTPKPTQKVTPTPKYDTRIDKLIKVAKSKIGCEYVLGDKGPDTFDCSGFVYYCLKQAGVSTSRMDASGFSKVSRWKNITSISDLKKGDLVFFCSEKSSRVSHVGIYIGDGEMIDASSSEGKVVRRAVSTNYWKKYFVNARRPWG
jgi:cell wall-associated NlpC family hydrolase